jgi:protein-disulfide isomerase
MCIITYGINFSLVFFAWLIRQRFSDTGIIEDTKGDLYFLWSNKAKSIPLFVIFITTVVSIWLFFPTYWYFKPPPLTADIPHGFTEAGHPWIGAENPVLEITEFSDYQCFQCKKMHFFLRQFIAQNPEKIRLIHRHYPMDHKFNPIVKAPFHVGAGKMALVAIASGSKDKFWEMNDLLYSIDGHKKVISVKELSGAMALDPSEIKRTLNMLSTRYQLHLDLRAGNELGIIGTPAYVIDGKLYQGQLPAETLKKVLE